VHWVIGSVFNPPKMVSSFWSARTASVVLRSNGMPNRPILPSTSSAGLDTYEGRPKATTLPTASTVRGSSGLACFINCLWRDVVATVLPLGFRG
jgi:hypothetical protein